MCILGVVLIVSDIKLLLPLFSVWDFPIRRWYKSVAWPGNTTKLFFEVPCWLSNPFIPESVSLEKTIHTSIVLMSFQQLRKAGVHLDENPVVSNKNSRKDFLEVDPVNNERREKVKEAMLHAWNSYVKYAWGMDELQVCLVSSNSDLQLVSHFLTDSSSKRPFCLLLCSPRFPATIEEWYQ